MAFEDKLENWLEFHGIEPDNLPRIDLYMDQITTFMEEQLGETKRFEEDKIFTKTMINNYSKNQLLPPSVKKKYSRNHLILLTYIYYLKNFLSISDIQKVLAPLKDGFYDDDGEMSFYEIYEYIYQFENHRNNVMKDSVMDSYNEIKTLFDQVENKADREKLQKFSYILLLGYDIYLKKHIIESMIDEYFPEVEDKKKKKKK